MKKVVSFSLFAARTAARTKAIACLRSQSLRRDVGRQSSIRTSCNFGAARSTI
jgi:hypothetical protein